MQGRVSAAALPHRRTDPRCPSAHRPNTGHLSDMTSTTISLLVAACIFAGALAGMALSRLLPVHHLTKETQDVIRLGTGMLSVLASLVLGLLVATAKTSYDTTDRAIRTYAAEIALLNETLRDYGGPATVPRDLLRSYVQTILRDGWPSDGDQPAVLETEATRRLMEQVREAIRALKPVDEAQKALQETATTINLNLLRQRWQLIEQQGPGVQRVILGVLVLWVTVIFASFGINAPRNNTVVAAFLICGLSIGGAIFLILEMDRPLDGVMQISSWPMRNVLAQMDW